MDCKRILNPTLWVKDEYGNFIGEYEEGDYLNIWLENGKLINGAIFRIYTDEVLIETEEEYKTIKYEDIEKIEED